MKYCVGLCYSGYVWQEVEAENEESAYYKAVEIAENACHDLVITDWQRWADADQVVVPD